MAHNFVLKDGEFDIFSDIKTNIADYLNCVVIKLLASFFFQQLEVETFCWAIRLWVAILQESLFTDIVLTVSEAGAGVSWLSFNIRIQSWGNALHNARYFRKLEDSKQKLVTKHVRRKEFDFVEDIFNSTDSSVVPFSVIHGQAFYFNKPVIPDDFL